MKFSPLIFFLCCGATCFAQETNILDEGGFDEAVGGQPVGFKWSGFAGDQTVTPNSFKVVSDETGQFVRLTVPPMTGKEVAWVELIEAIPLPTAWTALKVGGKFRLKDYLQGSEPWHGAKLFVTFWNADGEAVGGEIPAVSIKENLQNWTPLENEIQIPSGATSFKLKAGFIGSSGLLDVDDITVIAVTKP